MAGGRPTPPSSTCGTGKLLCPAPSPSSFPAPSPSSFFLQHIISARVSMDPAKVEAVIDWPQPKPVRELRGFLGLAGTTVNSFKIMVSLLDLSLSYFGRKDFSASVAFDHLKQALISATVLTLPDLWCFRNEYWSCSTLRIGIQQANGTSACAIGCLWAS